MPEEVLEQVELERGEVDDALAAADLVRRDIHDQIRAAQHLAARRPAAPQESAHPREQLVVRERLHQVVVRAGVEPEHAVGDRVARREHQDRHVGAGAQPTADLDAVDARKHHVEHDEIGRSIACGRERRRAVRGDLHGVALVRDGALQRRRKARVVVDHEDPPAFVHLVMMAGAHCAAVGSPRNTAGHAVTKNAKWLDAVAAIFGAIVGGFYKLPGTGAIKTLLHGTWPLGHPLHPAITDITIGAYTAAFALDVLYLFSRDTTLLQAADFVLIVAFASSLVSILSGLTDWNDTDAEERRTGMLHGLIMVVATMLFTSSILIRLNGGLDQRSLAIALSSLGWIVMLVGAFFGGEMPYGYGTQVNRQAWSEHPTKWTKLDVSAKGLEDRKPVVGNAKGTEILVVKIDDKIYALGNKCTHAGGPLNEGTFVGTDRCEIQCPWHGSVFCAKDGGVRQGPATFPEPAFETRINDAGAIEVRAR